MDSALRHPLLPRRRRHLDAVRAAEQPDDAVRRLVGVGGDPDARRAVHGGVPDPVGPHQRRVLRAGRDPVLHVLRGDADPDVHHHRRLGRAEPGLRGAQVLPLHAAGLAADAGGADLPLQRVGDVLDPRVVPRAAVAQGAGAAVRRVLPVVRGQGADVAGAHMAAGRPRRGADRRLGDPRGDHAEDRRLRLRPLHPAHRAGRVALPVGIRDHAVADRRRLHRLRRAGAGRHEEADRVLVDLAHGIRDARLLPVQRARHARAAWSR